MIEVEIPPFKELVNPPFAGLLENENRIIFLWGGRGSGKSVSVLRYLIIRCLQLPYFKCILIRKVYDTIKESMFEALKYEIEVLGLTELFEFRLNPMEIRCINGNKFIARGLDKPEKIRGVKEPSFVWYEEGNQITHQDFITVSTTLRSPEAPFLQEIFSFNPETHGENYEDFWLYKYFFMGRHEKTFEAETVIENPVTKEEIITKYTSIFSTYHDNPFIPPSFIVNLEQLKKTNPYYYGIFCLGLWGNKSVDTLFYKCFSMELVQKVEYDPTIPLHISFDENVNPYLTLTIHQVRGCEISQIDEILLSNPRNTLRDTCEAFKKKYGSHKEGLFIYGDRTSKKEDVKLEKGQNFFTLVREHLKEFNPSFRIPSVNPNVKSRGQFINDCFFGLVEGVKISFSDKCTTTIAEYMNVKEAGDGTKEKKKVNGVEPFGHISDANDYLFIEVLKNKYNSYISGNRKPAGYFQKRSVSNRPNRI